MPTKEQDGNLESSNNGDGLSPDQAFEAWRHYANVGGVDKNTMVSVASWLLGGSAAIIAFIATNFLSEDSFGLTQPVATLMLAGAGSFVSLAAGFIALLYGGYANWNWARAHDIARVRKWKDLLPETNYPQENGEPTGLTAYAAQHADPKCAPMHLASIFIIFFRLALVSTLVHLSILIWSVASIR